MPLPLLPEITGGGAALVDVDGDGDLDAYFVQGGWRLDGGVDAQQRAPSDRLFINRGDGFFDPAGGTGVANDDAGHGYGMGVAAGDYDNDGDTDLYVTNVGPNALLQNDGTGVFENVAATAGVDDPGWGTAAAFVDLDVDGDLDLFVVNYMSWSVKIERDCRVRGALTYCAPGTYKAPALDRLFRNDGNGRFTDVTVEAGINRAYGNGLGIASEDFSGDGLPDVFVANDQMVNQLWLNRGNLRFGESAAEWGVAVDDHGVAKAGMGVGVGDVDNDADVDLLVVNLGGETDSFFRNEGGYFVDATARVGLGSISRRHTRFGVALADFDNDGWLDVYEANGKVNANIDPAVDTFAEPNILYGGRGDTGAPYRLNEISPQGGVATPLVHTSRAVVFGDVDNDGGLDLLVVNRDAAPYLLMNRVAERGNWVRFRVLDSHERDAIGAHVSALVGDVRVRRTVQPASSYLAANDPRVHIGLGRHTARAVIVRWPDGEEEMFGDFSAGSSVELRRGEGSATSSM